MQKHKGLFHDQLWSASYACLRFLLLLIPPFHCIPLSLLSDTLLLVNSVFHLLPSRDYSGPDDDAAARLIRTMQLLLASKKLTKRK